jgi:hypothetical protein
LFNNCQGMGSDFPANGAAHGRRLD